MADKLRVAKGGMFAATVPQFTAVVASGVFAAGVEAAPQVVVGITPAAGTIGDVPVAASVISAAPISAQVLDRAVFAMPDRAVGVPFERVRFLNPELAASIAGIRERDGLPRANVDVPIAPSDALSDTQLFESANVPGETWLLPRYRVRIDTLNDGSERYRIRLAPRPPGYALSVTLEPYPAPELATAAATARILPHEMAILLRYSLAGTGIEKEITLVDRAPEDPLVTVSAQLSTLPEATEVFFALTEPASNARLIVRRLVRVAIPVDPPADTGNVDWNQIFIQPIKVNAEFVVPVDPGDPVPPERVDTVGLSQIVTDRQPGMLRTFEGARVGGLSLSGGVRDHRIAALSDRRLRKVLAVDPDVVIDHGMGTHEPPAEKRFRVVSRTLDDLPAPAPFFFPAGAHGYIFEGFAAAGRSSSGSIPHQVTWKGRSHTYYQEASRRQVFYYLPDSFKLVRTPEAPHVPMLAVEFRSPDGGLEGMRAIVRFAAAPFTDPDRPAAAALALTAEVPEGEGEPSLQPLLADRSRLRFDLELPGAGASTPVEGAILDVRLGLTAALDLSLADFQAVFDALVAGGSSVIFSGAVEVAVGDGGQPAEQVPFRGRLDDLVGELFTYAREADPAGGLQVSLANAIESPLRVESLGATLLRGDIEVDAGITGLDLPVASLEPTKAITFTAGGAAVPSATLDDTIVFDLSGVRAVPDRNAIWTAMASSHTAAFLRRIDVLTPAAQFAGDDPLLEIDVELRLATGGLTKTVVLTADAPAVEVSVPFPLADVVLGVVDTGAFNYQVRVIRANGQTVGAWKTDTTDHLWVYAADAT